MKKGMPYTIFSTSFDSSNFSLNCSPPPRRNYGDWQDSSEGKVQASKTDHMTSMPGEKRTNFHCCPLSTTQMHTFHRWENKDERRGERQREKPARRERGIFEQHGFTSKLVTFPGYYFSLLWHHLPNLSDLVSYLKSLGDSLKDRRQ